MSTIVTDERRRNRPKGARPFVIALGSPLDFVASLVRATGPAFAPRLANGLPKAITMFPIGQDRL
jgi:hypothetical protein